MHLEDYKQEYLKRKAKEMKRLPGDKTRWMGDLVQRIRIQDKLDEQFILKRKILPVSVGLILLIIVFMITRITNPILFAGSTLVFLALTSILILFVLECRNISKEDMDMTLLDFLNQRKRRLESWRSTPVLHTTIFGVFVIGLIMMILGNTSLVIFLDTSENILIYIGANLMILIISWLVGVYRWRKRYRQQHLPLIRDIANIISELGNDTTE